MRRLIYHITHIDNLPSIIADGRVWSDRQLLSQPANRTVIGFPKIKIRRLHELAVHCHAGTMVGDYVPFYFCPRSPMLYVIHQRNPELSYLDGQDRIVHLVSTVDAAVEAAVGRHWAFSDGNAGARYTQFSADLQVLDSFVNWTAVQSAVWSDPAVKEKKQAEFLVQDWFPWTAFVGIGVRRPSLATEVQNILEGSDHQPKVVVKPTWCY